MPRVLHLVKREAAPLAAAVIARSLDDPDASVTVVLLDGGPAPGLPGTTPVRRLGGDLDHDGLLDLIFAHDHVISW